MSDSINPNGRLQRIEDMKAQIDAYMAELVDAFNALINDYTGEGNQRPQVNAYNAVIECMKNVKTALNQLIAVVSEE